MTVSKSLEATATAPRERKVIKKEMMDFMVGSLDNALVSEDMVDNIHSVIVGER